MPDYGITYDASAYLVNYGSFTSGVRGIVIHSLECDAVPHIAEQLSARGGWLDNEGLAPQRMTDPVSIVRCVPDLDSAGHIGGPGNQHYVGVEVSGRAAWVRSQWLDGGNAQAALEHQARAAAGLYLLLGRSYNEIRWLSLAQLRAGSPFGMCTHNDITLSGVSQTTHWDPGLGYPFAWFLTQVQSWFNTMTGTPTPVAPPEPPVITPPAVIPSLEDIMAIVTDGKNIGSLDSGFQYFHFDLAQWAAVREVLAKMPAAVKPPTVTISAGALANLPCVQNDIAAFKAQLAHMRTFIDGNQTPPQGFDGNGQADRARDTLAGVNKLLVKP